MTEFNTPNTSAYDTLMHRRSVKAKDMGGDGLPREDMVKILKAAMRVPDHGKLAPWRFLVLEGSEREQLGELISDALVAENACNSNAAEKMKGYATQGPTLVVAVYSPSTARPIPEWEQQLSMGASVMNMLTAATALGYASQWLTGWATFSDHVARGLGLTEDEKIAGLVFFGDHPQEAPTERPRPDFDSQVHWGFPGEARE